jgi:hypothetical protein
MLKFRWLIIIVLLVALLGTASPVFADGPPGSQENPQIARETFSGIALLSYYSSSLDYIIQLDQNGSDTNLEKMPFANVPQVLDNATGGFASSGTVFTASIVNLFGLWDQENTYVQQYRLNDAEALYTQITDQLPAAQQQLSQIESSVVNTGIYLNIAALSSTSGLTVEYNVVMAKIQQLLQMLGVLSRSLIPTQLIGLVNSNSTPEQIAAMLKPTQLTLTINPLTAYVGDNVNFQGALSSKGIPLPGRIITLLLNNADLLTVQTNAQGQFHGTFQLPYLYINQMPVQAIYYPQGDDAGIYVAATSPVVDMTVLFYTAQLTLQLDNTAYPGKEAMLTGTFDYGSDPVPQQRAADLYLDNNIEDQLNAGPVFSKSIMLDAQITPGNHLITVSAPADGRYAPVMTSYVMDVTLATTILELHLPVIGFIPGSIQLSGKAYSSLGPLDNAAIVISDGKTSKQIITAADGTFSTKFGIGMGASLLGTQTVTVKVQPQEPWNAPVTRAKNIFLIYFINIGLLLAILIFMAVYLPRRFKKWFTGRPGKKIKLPGMVVPETVTVYAAKEEVSPKEKNNTEKEEEAKNPVLYWYRIALKFVQDFTKKMLKPHQTLREYGREASQVLGPAGKYFLELTYLLEKRLYGKHETDANDNQQSQQLAAEIQKQAGNEK